MVDTKRGADPEEATCDMELQGEQVDACGLCAALFSEREERASCGDPGKPAAGRWRFMTDREYRVHRAMRSLREKATRIKERIRAIERGLQDRRSPPRQESLPASRVETAEELRWEQEMADELLYHCDRLANLRAEWKQMDMERMAAQEERMRLLGHIQ